MNMTDLKSARLIKLKGILFLIIGLGASALLIVEQPTLKTAVLLAVAVWSFCRFYYFAFYVIEKYVDPSFRFSGLIAFTRYLLSKPRVHKDIQEKDWHTLSSAGADDFGSRAENKMLEVILIALPLLAWVLLFLLGGEVALRFHLVSDWRLSWIAACLGWGALLTAITELCSLAHALNQPTIAISWLAADVLLLTTVLLFHNNRPADLEELEDHESFANFVAQTKASTWGVKWMLGVTAFLLLLLFAIALGTAPTNVDSISYHLARMAHWIQQSSVAHYPTDDLRQIEFGPWSSFATTHLFLLWGNDQLLNLVQWFAMLSTVLLLTWIVERLGCLVAGTRTPEPENRLQRMAFTALCAITIPIGVVESFSTQNDYTAALWFLSFCAFGLLLWRRPFNPWYVAGAALSCSLGVLTKATTYIYAAPLAIIGGLWWLQRVSVRPRMHTQGEQLLALKAREKRMTLYLVFAAIFIALAGPHMLRNYALFGSPIGSREMILLERNQKLSPRVTASNFVRNLALHTNTGIPWLTRRLGDAMAAAHRWTGQDPTDPATTLKYCRYILPKRFVVTDSIASCFVHVGFAALALLLLLFAPRKNAVLLMWYALAILGFALFCTLLKWQLWHTRIHLAWLLLLSPLIAIAFTERLPRWAVHLSASILVVFAGFTLCYNSSRPVFDSAFLKSSREKQYFVFKEDQALIEPLEALADQVVASGRQTVGLKAYFCDFEYPFWVMLRNRGFKGQLQRCFVDNATSVIHTEPARPDVIITVYDIIPPEVAAAYPHVDKLNGLTVLWAKAPIYASSKR